jgi:signal transduction histidine kinase
LHHFGLQTALNDLAEAVRLAKPLSVELNVQVSGEMKNELNLNLYRIVQELINNTLKHASATQIRIEITEIEKEYVNLIYEDDGIGFTFQNENKGMGLKNIQSRVDSSNGQLTIESKPGAGVTVIIEIPINE